MNKIKIVNVTKLIRLIVHLATYDDNFPEFSLLLYDKTRFRQLSKCIDIYKQTECSYLASGKNPLY
jgi:hypothetical protein